MKQKGKDLFVYFFALFLYFFLATDNLCFIKRIFGIPCPSCGMTRAYLSLFSGNIRRAFFYHPLFWMIPIVFFLYLQRNRFQILRKNGVWIGILLLFLAVYIWRMVLFFPNQAPMNFTEEGLIPWLFFEMKEMIK